MSILVYYKPPGVRRRGPCLSEDDPQLTTHWDASRSHSPCGPCKFISRNDTPLPSHTARTHMQSHTQRHSPTQPFLYRTAPRRLEARLCVESDTTHNGHLCLCLRTRPVLSERERERERERILSDQS